MPRRPTVPPDVAALLATLAEGGSARRGSVSERYMKCGKATCACHTDDDARHGPYVSWSRVVDGKTRSFYVDVGKADIVRAQVEEGRALRGRIEDLWEALERWADEEIATPKDASPETAKTGGSRTSSKRRSRPKSPP